MDSDWPWQWDADVIRPWRQQSPVVARGNRVDHMVYATHSDGRISEAPTSRIVQYEPPHALVHLLGVNKGKTEDWCDDKQWW